MLTIANVKNAAQAVKYFCKEDYYLGKDGEHAASWWGRAAEDLKLSDKVDRHDFQQLLNGQLPDGSKLQTRFDGARRVATDLTFSAPKSVSLEALVHEKAAVLAAHEAAVTEALRFVQDRQTNVRVSHKGRVQRESTDNILVARFQHHTSRAMDPQLHTHCLVMNLTRTPDGQYKAQLNDDLYKHKMATGAVYRAELARQLQALGYQLRLTHADGRFELAHFDKSQLERFSKRRAQIETALEGELGEKLKDLGLGAAQAAKRANLGTREAKKDVEPEALKAQWRAEAQAVGIAALTLVPQRGGEPYPVADVVRSAQEATRWAVEHIEERMAVIEERDLIRYALERGVGEVTLREVEPVIEGMRAKGELLVAEEHRAGQWRYCSQQMLKLESRTVALMQQGRGCCEPIAKAATVDDKLAQTELTAGQARAVLTIAQSPDQVLGVQGYAGTGKTRMLRVVRELAEQSGHSVLGMSVSAAAAEQLQSATGIESKTVALHIKAAAGRPPAFFDTPPKVLWVVDEASFLSTKDAHRLLERAHGCGARVLFVGDRQQLPAVEAGKPFAELMDRNMPTVVLHEIRRQNDPQLRNAVEHTIAKDYARALAALDGRIVQEPSAEQRVELVAQRYLQSMHRRETLVVSATNEECRAINSRIREGLIAEGSLSGPEAKASVLVRADMTRAQTKRALSYQEDDVVRFGRTYLRLGVRRGEYLTVLGRTDSGRVRLRRDNGAEVLWQPHRASKVEVFRAQSRQLAVGDCIRWRRNDSLRKRQNGEHAFVTAVDPAKKRAKVQLQDGSTQALDLSAERHWEHGYASTVHAAQGATCRTLIANINTANEYLVGHESWYVALSRGRDSVHIITDDRQRLPEAIATSQGKDSALDKLERYEQRLQQQSRKLHRVQPWKLEAARDVRAGQGGQAFEAYRSRGLVHEHEQGWQAIEAVFGRWLAHHDSTESLRRADRPATVMVACENKHLGLLNTLARDELRHRDQLGEDVEVRTANGVRAFAVGEHIAVLRAMPELGIDAGELATIQGFSGPLMSMDIRGRQVRLDTSSFNHFDYGYAISARRAGGIAAERLVVLTSPKLDRESTAALLGRPEVEAELHWCRATFSTDRGLAAAMGRAKGQDLPAEYLGPVELREQRARTEAIYLNGRNSDDPEKKREAGQAETLLQQLQLRYEQSQQTEPWMRQATEAFADGRVAEGLEPYRHRGLVHRHTQDWQAIDALASSWQSRIGDADGALSLMLAYSRKDVALLNTLARDELRSRGQLRGQDHQLQTASGTRDIAVGDRLMFCRSERGLRVRNGTFGTVTAVRGSTLEMAVAGRRLSVDLGKYNHLEHGYALTPYRAARVQADNVLVLATEHFDRHVARAAFTRHSKHLEVHWSEATFAGESAFKEVLARDKEQPVADTQLGLTGLRRRMRRYACLVLQAPDAGSPSSKGEVEQARQQLPVLRRRVADMTRERRLDAAVATEDASACSRERDKITRPRRVGQRQNQLSL